MSKNKIFNVIVAGYGGQGVLTLAEIIALAAFYQGYEVKQAELHGLAQRGGTLESHLRFGKKNLIYSPLIRQGEADLIIGLELLETLRACRFASSKKTIIVSNLELFNPHPFEPERFDERGIISQIKRSAKKFEFIDIRRKIEKITQDTAMVNTFMLGYIVGKKLIPIQKKFILKALEEKIRPVFFEQNKKVFEMAYKEKS